MINWNRLVFQSDNLPSVPAKLYLECVQEHKGCLLLVCSDYGTENGVIAGMQCFFHSDNAPFSEELAHRYGSSTRNQRVENQWSHFRKSMASWWINFFKDLVGNGRVDLEKEIPKECLWLFQWCPAKCFKWHEEILEYTLYKVIMPQKSCRSS